MSWLDYVKSISVFNPAMGQTTKEDNMTINEQMVAANAAVDSIPVTDAKEIDAFLAAMTKQDAEREVTCEHIFQTEEDVGGTPI